MFTVVLEAAPNPSYSTGMRYGYVCPLCNERFTPSGERDDVVINVSWHMIAIHKIKSKDFVVTPGAFDPNVNLTQFLEEISWHQYTPGKLGDLDEDDYLCRHRSHGDEMLEECWQAEASKFWKTLEEKRMTHAEFASSIASVVEQSKETHDE